MPLANITYQDFTGENFFYDNTESSFWQNVGKRLLGIQIPNRISVSCPNGTAELIVKQRGTYTENGIKKPSMYVTVTNHIYGLAKSVYKKAYLTCVHKDSNNYKAYILRPVGDQLFADYGSLDKVAQGEAKTVQTPYESFLYWIRYYEKLSKGYTDQSKFLLADDSNNISVSSQPSDTDGMTAHQELFKLLHKYADTMIKNTLAVQTFTKAQVTECRRLWNELCKTTSSVASFNECLAKLVVLSPRKRDFLQKDKIAEYFAESEKDFDRIIRFEESLVCAMEASIGKTANAVNGMFADTEVYLANDTQKAEVMRYLNGFAHKDKVKRIWRVKPHVQEQRFSEYRKANHIRPVRKLWHGSPNANWASILQHGLLLSPNARITGKMFGNGIYFAVSPDKSSGYTSYRGSYWSRGQEPKGLMGLYATAYGTPYKPVNEIGEDAHRAMENSNCNCVHAVPSNMTGYMLRNEEIVFYDESAVVLNYLVEFGD